LYSELILRQITFLIIVLKFSVFRVSFFIIFYSNEFKSFFLLFDVSHYLNQFRNIKVVYNVIIRPKMKLFWFRNWRLRILSLERLIAFTLIKLFIRQLFQLIILLHFHLSISFLFLFLLSVYHKLLVYLSGSTCFQMFTRLQFIIHINIIFNGIVISTAKEAGTLFLRFVLFSNDVFWFTCNQILQGVHLCIIINCLFITKN
jgi:hypothetical protein